jgi:hypothetical protein
MNTKEEFNNMPYGTRTTQEVLKIVEKLKIKGYTLMKIKNSNGDYNYLKNFFIWKKDNKHEYIRLILQSEGFHEKILFYWNLETSFKPFRYNHNHRENANITSEKFKGNDADRYFNYFKNMVDIIK